MSQRLIRATVLAVLVVASGAAAGNQQVAQPPLSRDARWQEDLTFFSTEFAARQKDFATLYPPERFHKAIAALRQGAATWSDARMTLELMRLVASAGVAHTVVHFPSGPQGFHRLPLGLAWYSDGLAVLSASAPYQGALGTRVVRIGSMTPSELEAAVAPFIAHENPFWLQQLSPRYMATVELLHLVGAVDAIGPVQFTLARPDGPAFELQVAPAAPAAAVTLSSMYDVLPIPAMLARKQLQKNYWFEYLPASRALYIQYNRCQEDPALPFTEFARQVFAAAEAAPVERTIVDLRLNAGGNSRVIEPLLAGLKAAIRC